MSTEVIDWLASDDGWQWERETFLFYRICVEMPVCLEEQIKAAFLRGVDLTADPCGSGPISD